MTITEDVMANGGRRFANYIIDYAVRIGISYGIGWGIGMLYLYLDVYGPYYWLTGLNKFEEFLIEYVIALIYYFAFEATTGRTPGKFITGTKVVDADGDRPSAAIILKRTLCRIIPFDPFSFLANKPRGWHDSIPDVYVVEIKKYEEAKELTSSFDEIGTDIQNDVAETGRPIY